MCLLISNSLYEKFSNVLGEFPVASPGPPPPPPKPGMTAPSSAHVYVLCSVICLCASFRFGEFGPLLRFRMVCTFRGFAFDCCEFRVLWSLSVTDWNPPSRVCFSLLSFRIWSLWFCHFSLAVTCRTFLRRQQLRKNPQSIHLHRLQIFKHNKNIKNIINVIELLVFDDVMVSCILLDNQGHQSPSTHQLLTPKSLQTPLTNQVDRSSRFQITTNSNQLPPTPPATKRHNKPITVMPSVGTISCSFISFHSLQQNHQTRTHQVNYRVMPRPFPFLHTSKHQIHQRHQTPIRHPHTLIEYQSSINTG
jgi:hypothetical protein